MTADGGSEGGADQSGLHDLATAVLADERLADRLAAPATGGAFVDQAVRCAKALGIDLTEDGLRGAIQPDPLGLARWSRPRFGGTTLPPRHWLPTAVTATVEGVAVDWAWFGGRPFREPFYEETLRGALNLPFNRVFRYRTGLNDLIAEMDALEALKPDGFIFHMSRCGSTLVAQMLAALDDSIVISEAPPIDDALRYSRAAGLPDAARALRAMVTVLGRKRSRRERRYVVKLDCWHTLSLPVFRRAFPDVPWLFLHRDPVEVLVSQMRQRGMQTVPEYLPPAFYGIEGPEGATQEDYCARVLAAVCRAALDHHGLGGGLFLNYRQLPEAVLTAVLPHFGLSCSDAERERMRHAALADAKMPSLPFAGDVTEKQRIATDAVRRAAACHLGGIHAQLEALSGMRPIN